ncbi:MAG: protoporphyrinogen oxidase [Polyangiaceae bacterium]|nr:protoporphyrinogen oxidase [Polyangiaceae bacterium]
MSESAAPPPQRVVVVGAGLSGLSAAWSLSRPGPGGAPPATEVVVLEGSPRAGGLVGSDARDGFVVEHGADGFLSEKLAAIELAEALGIGGRLVRTLPSRQGAWVVHRGALRPIPNGFSLVAPSRLRPLLTTRVLSWRGKARAALDLVLPRGPARPDESLASFVRRRFGDEMLTALAQPLAGGIYNADPERLSMRATVPRFLDEERRSRSVILGLRRKARAAGSANAAARGARYSLFASFDQGMGVLTDTLVAALPPGALHLGERAVGLEPRGAGVVVRTEAGAYEADAVLLALPAWAQRDLLSPLDATLGDLLGALAYGSAATVTFGFAAEAFARPLSGYGFVVPVSEGRASIAATFASRKWPNRAPRGRELVRVFLGGPSSPPLDRADDVELVRSGLDELKALLGARMAPDFAQVRRYTRAMPHYYVGHVDRASTIEARAARHPWLRLAGNALRGVGIPDAIAAAGVAADSVLSPTG